MTGTQSSDDILVKTKEIKRYISYTNQSLFSNAAQHKMCLIASPVHGHSPPSPSPFPLAQAEQLHTPSFAPEEKTICIPILCSLQVNSVHLEKPPEKFISFLHSDKKNRLATGLVPCVEAAGAFSALHLLNLDTEALLRLPCF